MGHNAIDGGFHGAVFCFLVDYSANLQLFSDLRKFQCGLEKLRELIATHLRVEVESIDLILLTPAIGVFCWKFVPTFLVA